MFELPADFKWLPPWHALDDDADVVALKAGQIQAELESGQTIADGLVAELRRELPAGHRLSKCHLKVVGRCAADHNEFLFVTDDPDAPIACVHLTWKSESHPSWPHTHTFQSLDDWAEQMKREHAGQAGLRQ